MFRVFVVGKVAYISEESDSAFRKLHNLRSQDMELIASYANREALTSKQFERAIKQYGVTEVIDQTTPPPVKRRIPNIYRDFPPDKIEEFRARVSAKAAKRKMDDATKAKIAASKIGKPSGNKGKKRSIVANIQQSEGMKGKRTTADYITYHEPYSGKIIRLPEGKPVPAGYIRGLPKGSTDEKMRHLRMRRKKKRVDTSYD